MEYHLPAAADMPPLQLWVREEDPSPTNPLGVKGAGEDGIVAAGGAVANAVADALAPLGVEIRSLPLRPSRLRELIRAAATRRLMDRRIIHLDMDAFYASVEQRDRPELRGRPVAVGGSSRRAVVAAASYEARTFGVRSAMPMFRARHLCPELVVVDLRMEHYRAVSQQIRAILEAHTELIEPLALDEFYLDVSATTASIAEAGALARRMKEEIRSGTGLTASAGVAPSKFVAKIASDLRKPDGLVIVEPDAVVAFLAPLPVSRMWGVGQVTERRLKELGIHTLADIAATDPARLGDLLGKHGPRMVEFARGADPRGCRCRGSPSR